MQDLRRKSVREEKEHREGKIVGEEKEYREPPVLLALLLPRWIHASRPPALAPVARAALVPVAGRKSSRRSLGGRTRAGHRVDPLASTRRKKPRRDLDRSPAPTAASRSRRPHAFAAPASRPLIGGRSEVDLERRFEKIWRRNNPVPRNKQLTRPCHPRSNCRPVISPCDAAAVLIPSGKWDWKGEATPQHGLEKQAVPGPYPRHVGHDTARYRTGGPLSGPAYRLLAPRIYKRGLRSVASSRVTPNPKSYPRGCRRPLSSRAVDLSLLHSLSLRPSLHSLPVQQRCPSPSLSRGPCRPTAALCGGARVALRGGARAAPAVALSRGFGGIQRSPAALMLPCKRTGEIRPEEVVARSRAALLPTRTSPGRGGHGSSAGRRSSPPPWRIRSPRRPSLPSPTDPAPVQRIRRVASALATSGSGVDLLGDERRRPPTPLERRRPSPLSLSAATRPRTSTACGISRASRAGPAQKSAHSVVPGPKIRPVAL
ncbi:uncharacterized protein [Miscanthus floridulus]|uniref:uncharacterized protein n=1 Tax=Miscanthus floridulus TaxID=154761 RepID=UPI00345B113D